MSLERQPRVQRLPLRCRASILPQPKHRSAIYWPKRGAPNAIRCLVDDRRLCNAFTAWNQAYKLADRKALNELLDDQLVLVNDDGSVQDKGEFLASIKKSNSQEQQVTPESIAVHVYGNAATATGVFRAKGVEGGKPYLKRERFLDTWIYKDGKWRCATAAAITVAH